MCGINGIFDPSASAGLDSLERDVQRMATAIEHRGPDDAGAWVDAAAGIALGHRRLSIIDLSPLGHQPMTSASGRYVLTFNGEIYNFPELRAELEGRGYPFRSHSDTEVMLAAFDHFGLATSLRRFNGMFAFGLWDRQERTLTLARDRLGEKPLYYGWSGATLLFGSELKALRAHPAFHGEVDRDALASFLRYCYVPAPLCIYRGVKKLPAASYVTFAMGDHPGRHRKPEPYWSAREHVERGQRSPFAGDEREATDALDGLLRDAVRARMVADVPLGAFLSGGIDSSTVVSLMQAQSSRPIRTFSIGFAEQDYNEAHYAKQVARHLGTQHTELYLRPEDALAVIPRLGRIYDEPFADSSQIATVLVSELARRDVTVSLSGDGGDELFGGYQRYQIAADIWRSIARLPAQARRLVGRGIAAVPPQALSRKLGVLTPLVARYGSAGDLGDKLHKFASILSFDSPYELYARLMSHWTEEAPSLVEGAVVPPTSLTDGRAWPERAEFARWMMFVDTVTYLPDDILVKVDRASMSVALEARVPLLDHRVAEFAWSLPPSLRVRGRRGKWLLRQVLQRYVPGALMERPKMGFGVPIDAWLRGPLRDWAEALLDERRLRETGLLRVEPIRRRFREHLSGARDWDYSLWSLLMFQAWLDESRAVIPALPRSSRTAS